MVDANVPMIETEQEFRHDEEMECLLYRLCSKSESTPRQRPVIFYEVLHEIYRISFDFLVIDTYVLRLFIFKLKVRLIVDLSCGH